MRLPSFGEALQLSRNHDLPDLSDHDAYRTDDSFIGPDTREYARAVYDEGAGTLTAEASLSKGLSALRSPRLSS